MPDFVVDEIALEELFSGVMPHLDERQRRIVTGNIAISLGRGGITAVAAAAKMSRSTVQTAVGQIDKGIEVTSRVREPGAGPKLLIDSQPGLLQALDDLVDPDSRGDPMCPLRWTSKSTRNLAGELCEQGYEISYGSVYNLLVQMGYSMQAPAKELEGKQHPERNAQFDYLKEQIRSHMSKSQPVISVDCKKKELVGNHANGGTEWQHKGQPQKVADHDFPDPEVPKAVPYGVYDVGANEGWVSVGDDGDTGAFAVNTIRQWWSKMGSAAYPNATELLVTADAGGSNAARSRLWKRELADLARETGLAITVCHLPPGTSKWNKIEHRLFSHISMNWRGRPLTDHQTIVDLIANTTTKKGLKVNAALDEGSYPRGIKITDAELKALPIDYHEFHGEWNYSVRPTPETTNNSCTPLVSNK